MGRSHTRPCKPCRRQQRGVAMPRARGQRAACCAGRRGAQRWGAGGPRAGSRNAPHLPSSLARPAGAQVGAASDLCVHRAAQHGGAGAAAAWAGHGGQGAGKEQARPTHALVRSACAAPLLGSACAHLSCMAPPPRHSWRSVLVAALRGMPGGAEAIGQILGAPLPNLCSWPPLCSYALQVETRLKNACAEVARWVLAAVVCLVLHAAVAARHARWGKGSLRLSSPQLGSAGALHWLIISPMLPPLLPLLHFCACSLQEAGLYDVVITNDTVEGAVKELRAVRLPRLGQGVRAGWCRGRRQRVGSRPA